MTRDEALLRLLALPDPPELRRGYHYTLPRHPAGRCSPCCTREVPSAPDEVKRDLGTAYVERRRQERQTGGDISCVVSVRRMPLQVVRRLA